MAHFTSKTETEIRNQAFAGRTNPNHTDAAEVLNIGGNYPYAVKFAGYQHAEHEFENAENAQSWLEQSGYTTSDGVTFTRDADFRQSKPAGWPTK